MQNGGNSKFSAGDPVANPSNPLGSARIIHIYIWNNNSNHLINEATCSDLILIFFVLKIHFFPAIFGFEKNSWKSMFFKYFKG